MGFRSLCRRSPPTSATARFMEAVSTEVSSSTMPSDLGIWKMMRKEDHSKVDSTTMNITPVSAARGTASMNLDPLTMNTCRRATLHSVLFLLYKLQCVQT